jgi:hypothetical protein
MSLERAAMRGKLAEAQDTRHRLRLKAEGLCTAIRAGLLTALVDVEEIDAAQAAQQMDDLVITMGELAALQGQIARLQRELR